jgi:ubiquinol-cytochrome c reductase cytochrome c1 subunit
MRKLLPGLVATLLVLNLGAAQAAEGAKIPERHWSFDGIFGGFDRAQLQRGLQIYREVCSGCHSLKYIAFRNLADLGFSEEEIKAIAEEYLVVDGPDDEGEMFERSGRPSDYFPSPFPNKQAAAAANGGAAPPDLSLIAKARAHGPDYIHALLVGYLDEPPADFELMEGLSYNVYFSGNQIAMAPPLLEGVVEYADGTEATLEQMSEDMAAFMMWTAEPKMEVRKQTGIKVILFLLVMTAIFYAIKKKVWRDAH